MMTINEQILRGAYLAMVENKSTFPKRMKPVVRAVFECEPFENGYATAGLTEEQMLELGRFVGVEFLTN